MKYERIHFLYDALSLCDLLYGFWHFMTECHFLAIWYARRGALRGLTLGMFIYSCTVPKTAYFVICV